MGQSLGHICLAEGQSQEVRLTSDLFPTPPGPVRGRGWPPALNLPLPLLHPQDQLPRLISTSAWPKRENQPLESEALITREARTEARERDREVGSGGKFSLDGWIS